MAHPVQQIVYRFGTFTLDLGNEELRTSRGIPIPLRPRSFALLRLLVENAGLLVTRDAILDALWPNVFVTDDSISQCVKDVRRALGAEATYLLRTVNRRGYVFTPQVAVTRRAPNPVPCPGGDRIGLTIMFSDIRGFTALTDTIDPAKLAQMTSIYFETIAGDLAAGGATIDRYSNDSVLAYWSEPQAGPEHAARACDAVMRVHAATARLVHEFVGRGWPPLPTTFAIHTGKAVVANFGPQIPAVVGAAVNFAVHLDSLNKHHGTHILASEATRMAAGPDFLFRQIDVLEPMNGDPPVPVHALLGRRKPIQDP